MTGRIMPVYPLTAGLSQKTVAGAVKKCLEVCAGHIPEVLSQKVRAKWELAAAEYSYDNIHFPKDGKALEIARRRFIFEELYVFCNFFGEETKADYRLPEGCKAILSNYKDSPDPSSLVLRPYEAVIFYKKG